MQELIKNINARDREWIYRRVVILFFINETNFSFFSILQLSLVDFIFNNLMNYSVIYLCCDILSDFFFIGF